MDSDKKFPSHLRRSAGHGSKNPSEDNSESESEWDGHSDSRSSFYPRSSQSMRVKTVRNLRTRDKQRIEATSKFEDEINTEMLNRIKAIFESADSDKGGSLSEEEFISAFSHLDGFSALSKDQLKTMFIRIDANANGSIDWDEFSTFLLLGSQGRNKMQDDVEAKEFLHQNFIDKNPQYAYHKDMITHIAADTRQDRYITVSRDGTVRFWKTGTLLHEKTIHNGSMTWITDCVYIHKTNELAVSSVDRVISIYNCANGELVRAYKGKKDAKDGRKEVIYRKTKGTINRQQDGKNKDAKTPRSANEGNFTFNTNPTQKIEMIVMEDLINAPMCMAYFDPSGTGKTGNFSTDILKMAAKDGGLPDANNIILPFQQANINNKKRNEDDSFEEDFNNTVLNGTSLNESHYLLLGIDKGYVQMYDINNSHKNSIKKIEKWSAHKDWVTKVMVATELDSIITSSLDATLQIVNIEKSKGQRTLKGHQKSVFSFDWSQSLKLIASCGLEREVRIWNPFISTSLNVLKGHKAPLVDVAFNSKDYQLISLSSDKVIKVWDMRTYKCLQTLSEKKVFKPEDKLSAMMFDSKNNVIVTGATNLQAWPMRRNFSNFKKSYKGHQEPLVAALYNDKFKQVVSADSSNVLVWDVENGDLVFRFSVERKIVSFCFDDFKRRIIVSSPDGSLTVFNYINGQMLKELENPDEVELSQILYITKESTKKDNSDVRIILAAGWNRRVMIWQDSESNREKPERVTEMIDSDINALAYCAPSTLICGCDDGSIHYINLQSGTPKLRSAPPMIKTPGNSAPATSRIAPYLNNNGEQSTTTSTAGAHTNDNGGGSIQSTARSVRRTDRRKLPIWERGAYIEDIIFLEQKATVLVSCSGDGYLRFWDIRNGALLYAVNAQINKEAICCGCTDEKNNLLIVGDNEGIITVFDISQMPAKTDFVDHRNVRLVKRFRAHRKAITSIQYIEQYQLILTASMDCTCEMFTLYGLNVGFFGQQKHWRLGDPRTYSREKMSQIKLDDDGEDEDDLRLSVRSTRRASPLGGDAPPPLLPTGDKFSSSSQVVVPRLPLNRAPSVSPVPPAATVQESSSSALPAVPVNKSTSSLNPQRMTPSPGPPVVIPKIDLKPNYNDTAVRRSVSFAANLSASVKDLAGDTDTAAAAASNSKPSSAHSVASSGVLTGVLDEVFFAKKNQEDRLNRISRLEEELYESIRLEKLRQSGQKKERQQQQQQANVVIDQRATTTSTLPPSSPTTGNTTPGAAAGNGGGSGGSTAPTPLNKRQRSHTASEIDVMQHMELFNINVTTHNYHRGENGLLLGTAATANTNHPMSRGTTLEGSVSNSGSAGGGSGDNGADEAADEVKKLKGGQIIANYKKGLMKRLAPQLADTDWTQRVSSHLEIIPVQRIDRIELVRPPQSRSTTIATTASDKHTAQSSNGTAATLNSTGKLMRDLESREGTASSLVNNNSNSNISSTGGARVIIDDAKEELSFLFD